MNTKFLGEGLLVLILMVGLVTAFSSGFSKAGATSAPVPEATAGGVNPVPLPGTSTTAVDAVPYSASGEGTFLANGDLVGAP